MRNKSNGHGIMKVRLYRTVKRNERDPAMLALCGLMREKNLSPKKISLLTNVGESTIDNWDNGKTSRPQHITMTAVARALGHEFELKEVKKLDYAAEEAKARSWHNRHNTSHAKKD
jgi:transcriptional regulator with XRE-family HTH domain